MVSETTSVVRVKQWYRTLDYDEPVTREKIQYNIHVDWDIGTVTGGEGGTYYFIGPPGQAFSPQGATVFGDAVNDSRVLIEREKMQFSTLEGEAARTAPADQVHFKHPGI